MATKTKIEAIRRDPGKIGHTLEELGATESDMWALHDLGLVGKLDDGRWFGKPAAFWDGCEELCVHRFAELF